MKKHKSNEQLTKDELWVLLIINHFSKHNGASINEIIRADKRKINLTAPEILIIIQKFKEKKLISSSIESLQEIYKMANEGKIVLKNNLNNLKPTEFIDFLSVAPDEIILNYRVYNIENSLFFGIIGIMLFQFSLFLIRSSKIFSALVIFVISLLLMGLTIGFLSNIITVVLYRYSKSLEEWIIKRKKIPEIIKRIREFLVKIPIGKVSLIIMILLIIGLFIFVNFIFWKKYPQDWEIFIYAQVIVGLISLIIFLCKKFRVKK